MLIAGLIITVAGFLVTLASLGLAMSAGGRIFVTLAGLAISLFGIIGVVNRAYLKDAIWKR